MLFIKYFLLEDVGVLKIAFLVKLKHIKNAFLVKLKHIKSNAFHQVFPFGGCWGPENCFSGKTLTH